MKMILKLYVSIVWALCKVRCKTPPIQSYVEAMPQLLTCIFSIRKHHQNPEEEYYQKPQIYLYH